jgi:putative transcriptional regulator
MKNNIRVERAIKRITQQQLAEMVGVSRQTINAIEAGKYIPSTVLSLKIVSIFEKEFSEVFQLEEVDWKKAK